MGEEEFRKTADAITRKQLEKEFIAVLNEWFGALPGELPLQPLQAAGLAGRLADCALEVCGQRSRE